MAKRRNTNGKKKKERKKERKRETSFYYNTFTYVQFVTLLSTYKRCQESLLTKRHLETSEKTGRNITSIHNLHYIPIDR